VAADVAGYLRPTRRNRPRHSLAQIKIATDAKPARAVKEENGSRIVQVDSILEAVTPQHRFAVGIRDVHSEGAEFRIRDHEAYRVFNPARLPLAIFQSWVNS
jgi:hypothetical protein